MSSKEEEQSMFFQARLPSLNLSKDFRRAGFLAAVALVVLFVFVLSRKYVPPIRPFDNRDMMTWYDVHTACLLDVTDPEISDLPAILDGLALCRTIQARRTVELVERIYYINQRAGSVVLPATFKKKVFSWLGNNEELFKEVDQQTIISIFNRITYEESIFNPLRGKRPGSNSGSDVNAYLDALVNETAQSCDFCRYTHFTARDTFGRIESKYAVTAANTFKYDGMHSLVMFRHHDPRVWTLPQFLDLMDVAMRWFDQAHMSNPRARFPHMMWDLLPKASASQLHPHAQASLSPQRYYGFVENLQQAMTEYETNFPHENYFTHLVEIHDVLGLAYHFGNATAIAYLTPKKESEIFIISHTPCEDFFTLIHHVLRSFMEEYGILAWSMGMSFPPFDEPDSLMPAIARVIDRGLPTSPRSDISALELFAASNVNADPFVVMHRLRASLDRRIDSNKKR